MSNTKIEAFRQDRFIRNDRPRHSRPRRDPQHDDDMALCIRWRHPNRSRAYQWGGR